MALRNVGNFYLYGTGVKQDFDKAAKWLQLAIKEGYNEAKIELDEIFDQTTQFKKANPNYHKWETTLPDLLSQPVVLL